MKEKELFFVYVQPAQAGEAFAFIIFLFAILFTSILYHYVVDVNGAGFKRSRTR
jgi:hypothetical protein